MWRKWAEVPINKEVLTKQHTRTLYKFIKGDNKPNIIKLQSYNILRENISKILKHS